MSNVVKRGVQCLRDNGVSYTMGRASFKLKKWRMDKKIFKDVIFTEEMREKEKGTRFPRAVTFSILTPLYNTNLNFLREMIQSVQQQTYPNWELCLCDGSDEEHAEVGRLCRKLAEEDSRIKYRQLDSNQGISANTNACIEIASGDYCGMLDHDDCLHPSALYEAMKVICEEQADLIYTDEAKFTDDPNKCFSPNFKPNFAKDDLRAHNYICHFMLYSRELLNAVGNYKSELDGSQDHDMVLRMSEKAKKIVHIPRILYFWRVHKGSVSAGVETKSYAVSAAHKAVAAQLERSGETGRVASISPYPLLYKIDYLVVSEPLVSVVVYGITSAEDLNRCIKYMEDQTRYYPVEVCLIEGTIDEKIFARTLISLPTVKPFFVVNKREQRDCGFLTAAVRKCRGEYIVFLNASSMVEVFKYDWVREMLMYAQRSDVGAVGSKVHDGNGAVYSAGIGLDREEPSLLHHFFRGEKWGSHGFEAGLCHVRNVTAVDGTCLMVSQKKLLAVGGVEESLGGYVFVDLCLRLRAAGMLNICTPFSAVRRWVPAEYGTEDKALFAERWKGVLSHQDPYYNPNTKKYMIL